MFSFNPLPCSPPHSTGCPPHRNLGRTDISAHHSVFHATYRRGSNYAAPCRGGRGQGQLSSHGARSRRPKDNSDQLKSRLCGETRGETGRGERRETLAGKLLITPAACLPVHSTRPLWPPQSVRTGGNSPFHFHAPSLLAGRDLARHWDPGRGRRRRRVSLRRHNLWGQSAIRFSLTLLLQCRRRCTAIGAARKNKFKVFGSVSPSVRLGNSDRTEGKGEPVAVGVGSTKLVCPILWPNKMIF